MRVLDNAGILILIAILLTFCSQLSDDTNYMFFFSVACLIPGFYSSVSRCNTLTHTLMPISTVHFPFVNLSFSPAKLFLEHLHFRLTENSTVQRIAIPF